jgi:hypothetical protein
MTAVANPARNPGDCGLRRRQPQEQKRDAVTGTPDAAQQPHMPASGAGRFESEVSD